MNYRFYSSHKQSGPRLYGVHLLRLPMAVLCLTFLAATAYSQPVVYWTDPHAGKIQRMDVNRGEAEDVLTATLLFPRDLALDLNAGKMYWTSEGKDRIRRSNLDGSQIEDIIETTFPNGLALDLEAGKMYWTGYGGGADIQRANLDGSEREILVEDLGSWTPGDFALDLKGGKMYWIASTWRPSIIQRANLDGSEVENMVVRHGLSNPRGIALDLKRRKMYWALTYRPSDDHPVGIIQQANLDGTNVENLAYAEPAMFWSTALDLSAVTSTTARLQLIHASSYAEAAEVDIYFNDALTVDDFAFRAATPFTDQPAGILLKIDITAPDVPDNSAPLFTKEITLTEGEAYVAIAAGDPMNRADQPPLDLFVKDQAREVSVDANTTDVLDFNGIPDTPPFTLTEVLAGAGTFVSDLAFGNFNTEYIAAHPAVYQTRYEAGDYVALLEPIDLTQTTGRAAVIVESGFLTPPTASDPGHVTVFCFADGTTLSAAVSTPVEATPEIPDRFALRGNYPNPFNPVTTVRFDLPQRASVRLDIFDLLGRRVLSVPEQVLPAGTARSIQVNAASLASGLHLYRVTARMATITQVEAGRMMIVK